MRFGLAVLVSSFAVASIAAPPPQQAVRLKPAGQVAFERRDWMDVLIPVAGSAAGAFGTFFKSDMYIVNYRDIDQAVNVVWLPRATNNVNAPKKKIVIPAGSFAYYDDFVATVLNASGIGAIWFRAIDANGLDDSYAKLDVVSRIWTNQAGGSGTVSQALLSTRALDLDSDKPAFAPGLRQDENFRTNVGVVNWDKEPRTFTVTVSGTRADTKYTFVVQPFGFDQVALPAGNFGAIHLTVEAENIPARRYFWSGYATSVDNRSGDGWVFPLSALGN